MCMAPNILLEKRASSIRRRCVGSGPSGESATEDRPAVGSQDASWERACRLPFFLLLSFELTQGGKKMPTLTSRFTFFLVFTSVSLFTEAKWGRTSKKQQQKKTRDRRGYVHMHRVSSISWSAVSTSENSERRNRVTWKKQKNKKQTNKQNNNNNNNNNKKKRRQQSTWKKKTEKEATTGEKRKNNMRKKHRRKILKKKRKEVGHRGRNQEGEKKYTHTHTHTRC